MKVHGARVTTNSAFPDAYFPLKHSHTQVKQQIINSVSLAGSQQSWSIVRSLLVDGGQDEGRRVPNAQDTPHLAI